MMVAEVRQLHKVPPLNDIAGRLRDLANRIESGELTPDYILCVTQDDSGSEVFHFGDAITRNEVAGCLFRAAGKV